MSKKNLPNIPIYIGDWEKDCNVLSLEAEAAWLRIVFKMFTKGKQSSYKVPTKALQNLWRCTPEKMKEILDELIFNEISDIVIAEGFVEFVCRRFLKENHISEERKKAVSAREDRKKKSTKQLQNFYKSDTKGLQTTDIDYENENREEEKGGVGEKEEKRKSVNEIIKEYHSRCKAFPKIKKVNKEREKLIRTRQKEYTDEEIIQVFEKSNGSKFLCGENDRNWTAGFDWIMKSANFIKILEGTYENNTNNRTNMQSTDRTSEAMQRIAAKLEKESRVSS